MMNSLEDFERRLAEEKANRERKREKIDYPDKESGNSKHRHHHKSSNKHRNKRLKLAKHEDNEHTNNHGNHSHDKKLNRPTLKRDEWMEADFAVDFEYKRQAKETTKESLSNFVPNLKIHKNELNQSLLEAAAIEKTEEVIQHTTDDLYTIGDASSNWRMARLKAIHTQAEQSGRSLDEVALEIYGDTQKFDEAREEKNELERRNTLRDDYAAKQELKGEPFLQRGLNASLPMTPNKLNDHRLKASCLSAEDQTVNNLDSAPDPTLLNRMRAEILKSKLKKSPNVAKLEDEYNKALARTEEKKSKSTVITLGPMECRMLAGPRTETKHVDSKGGQSKRLVDNENMSIEDMVREERRTNGQIGGEGMRAAERIAKDSRFQTGLDYMDENASRLAKRVHKSDIGLKNFAINEYQKLCYKLENVSHTPRLLITASTSFLTLWQFTFSILA